MKTIDINVAAPDMLAKALREAAQEYRESQLELSASWGDLEAGKVWDKLADILDATADKCDEAIAKYFV